MLHSPTISETIIPREFGRIIDITALDRGGLSAWLMLASDGRLFRIGTRGGEIDPAGSVQIPSEVGEDPFGGHVLGPRLYASQDGRFAAVVNDYGRYGRVIELQSGNVTLMMDGGNYCSETVPFSFAFADWQGQTLAIHRTAWNRLDVSDASSGQLLTERGPTSYERGQERPVHYLDYFHGRLYISPQGTHILDDGWVWHPVGIPVVWSIDRWLSENVWESEDGATRKEVCAREGYWDCGYAWLDEETVAIGGIGDDDTGMVDGARIFDITATGSASGRWRSDWLWAREIKAFEGPAGRFFADDKGLYSVGEAGLSRWDPRTGARTGHIENFHPTHHSRVGELVQLVDGILRRWCTTDV